MRLFPVLSAVVALLAVPALLLAASAAVEGEDAVSLLVNDDLYKAGGQVVLAEPVAGDAMIAGGSLIVNAAVNGDLQIAGGSIVVNGPVGDDVRAAGGDITIISSVAGDLVVFGGNVVVAPGAVIGGDMVVGAGSLVLAGTVAGDLLAGGGVLEVTGTVRGSADLRNADELKVSGTIQGPAVLAARKMELGPGAGFGADVTYWREGGELDFTAVPVSGSVRFDPDLGKGIGALTPAGDRWTSRRALGVFGFWFLLSFLAGAVTLVPVTLILSGTFREASWHLSRAFWKSTLVGLLIYVVTPITAALLAATVVGIPLGVFLLAAFLFALLFGRVIAALALAAWIERRRNRTWSKWRLLLTAVGILLVLKLVGAVPFAGWLLLLVVAAASLGAVLTALWESRQVGG